MRALDATAGSTGISGMTVSWFVDTAGGMRASLASVLEPMPIPRKPVLETGISVRYHREGIWCRMTIWYWPRAHTALELGDVHKLKIGIDEPRANPWRPSTTCACVPLKSSTLKRKFVPFD